MNNTKVTTWFNVGYNNNWLIDDKVSADGQQTRPD